MEGRRAFRQIQPRQLAPRVYVNIRRNRLGSVKRPSAHEQAVAGDNVVAAPQGGAARRTKEYVVGFSGASHQPVRLRSRRIAFDKSPFDPEVDREGTAGKTLTISAVAGMHDQRTGGQLVSNRTARAPALEVHD